MAAPPISTRPVIRYWSSPRGQVGAFTQSVTEGGVVPVMVFPKKHSMRFTGEDSSQ